MVKSFQIWYFLTRQFWSNCNLNKITSKFAEIENSTLFHFCARMANSKSSTLPFFDVFFSYYIIERKGVEWVSLQKIETNITSFHILKWYFFCYLDWVLIFLHWCHCCCWQFHTCLFNWMWENLAFVQFCDFNVFPFRKVCYSMYLVFW